MKQTEIYIDPIVYSFKLLAICVSLKNKIIYLYSSEWLAD